MDAVFFKCLSLTGATKMVLNKFLLYKYRG